MRQRCRRSAWQPLRYGGCQSQRTKDVPDNKHANCAPEKIRAVVSCLNTEDPPIPVWVVLETDVLNLEIGLAGFPFRRPSQMHLLEMPANFGKFGLTKSRDFDLVGVREDSPEHGDPAFRSGDANRMFYDGDEERLLQGGGSPLSLC